MNVCTNFCEFDVFILVIASKFCEGIDMYTERPFNVIYSSTFFLFGKDKLQFILVTFSTSFS